MVYASLIFSYLLMMFLDVWHDHFRAHTRHIDIHHPSDTLVAGVVYILLTLTWKFAIGLTWLNALGIIMIAASLRWIVHDTALNVLAGKPFDYQGDGINDALTDKFLKSLNIKPIVFKLITFVVLSSLSIFINYV